MYRFIATIFYFVSINAFIFPILILFTDSNAPNYIKILSWIIALIFFIIARHFVKEKYLIKMFYIVSILFFTLPRIPGSANHDLGIAIFLVIAYAIPMFWLGSLFLFLIGKLFDHLYKKNKLTIGQIREITPENSTKSALVYFIFGLILLFLPSFLTSEVNTNTTNMFLTILAHKVSRLSGIALIIVSLFNGAKHLFKK